MNSMIFVALLVTVMMGTDRVIGGKQHNSKERASLDGDHRKAYFQSSGNPKYPEDFMDCIDKEQVLNAFQMDVLNCLHDKWMPYSTSGPRDQRKCCYLVDAVCSRDKLMNSECTPMDGYAEALERDYQSEAEGCKHDNIVVTDESCAALNTTVIMRPECQRYQQCKPNRATVSPVVTTGGHDPNAGAPGQGSGPGSLAKPKPQHSGADIKSPLSFAVISLLAFIIFIQM